MLNPNVFNSVKPSRVSEIIIEQIRNAILQGKIKPGDRLPPEHKLIETFQASKFSVREALRSLEILGFLEVKKGPRGGAIVTEVDFRPVKHSLFNFLQFQNVTVRNVSEIRMLIETGVAELAAMRRKKKDLETIRHQLEKAQKQYDAGRNISDLNVEFHLTVAKSSYNPILTLTVDYILDLLRQCNMVLKPDRDNKFSANNLRAHWEIFRKIEDRDPKKAKEAMTGHLQEVEKRLRPLEEKLKVEFNDHTVWKYH
jgi:GntR family transcriptional repressor for pyruvate dehydrogenase complex